MDAKFESKLGEKYLCISIQEMNMYHSKDRFKLKDGALERVQAPHNRTRLEWIGEKPEGREFWEINDSHSVYRQNIKRGDLYGNDNSIRPDLAYDLEKEFLEYIPYEEQIDEMPGQIESSLSGINKTFFFKGLIILQIVSFFLTGFLTPDDPIYYEEMGGILDYLLIIYLLLWFLSLFLLYKFKSLGKKLFTILVVLGFPLTLSMPEPLLPNGTIVDSMMWFGGALDGAMLVMLYMTSISEKFQK